MNRPNPARKRAVSYAVLTLLFVLCAAVYWCGGAASIDGEVSGEPTGIARAETSKWIRQDARDEVQLRLEASVPMLTGVVVVAPSLELRGEITVCASSAAFAYDSITCVTVEPDGRFRIPASQLLDLQGRACFVSASAPGAMPSESIRTKCEGQLPRPLVLDRAGYSIAGTVVDHFGGPVAGARVCGDFRSGIGGVTTLTDDFGRFELWTGNGRLLVAAAGYGSVRSHGPVPDSDRRIELYPEAAIEGTVRDSDGTPRAGVHVELHSKVVDTEATTSDAEGHFRFSGLAPGDFALQAIDGARGAGPEPVRAPMGETVVLDLTLEARATLSGTIGFASGDECTSVSLVQLRDSGRHRFETQQIGADAGQYSIAGLPIGTYRLVAACSEAALDLETTIEVPAAEDIIYDVVFEERAASIFGHVEGVTDPGEWRVTARRASSDPKAEVDVGYRHAAVTVDGDFSVTRVGEGTWLLSVSKSLTGGVDLRDGPGTEVVVEGDDVTGVRLFPADEGTLELAVFHEGGEPARGQRAQVHRVEQFTRSCTTDDDGTCEVALPGELIFSAPGERISCNGEWRRYCPIIPEGSTVQLVIEDVISLEGRLTEISDGSPVSFALIIAIQFADYEYPVATTRTEEDGSFVLNDLPAHDETLFHRRCRPSDRGPRGSDDRTSPREPAAESRARPLSAARAALGHQSRGRVCGHRSPARARGGGEDPPRRGQAHDRARAVRESGDGSPRSSQHRPHPRRRRAHGVDVLGHRAVRHRSRLVV